MYLFSQINILIIFSCFTIRKNKFWFYWHSRKCLTSSQRSDIFMTRRLPPKDMVFIFQFSMSPLVLSCDLFFFPSIFQSKNMLWYNSTIHLKSRTNQNQKFLINDFKTCTSLTKEHCWEKSSMTQTHGNIHHDHDLEDSVVYR